MKNYFKIGWKPKLKSEVLKLLDENIGRTFPAIMVAIFFFNVFPKANEIKRKMHKYDLVKLETVAQQRWLSKK